MSACALIGLAYQGGIQTENGTVQTLWAPKKISPKMKKRKRKLLLSDKFLN